MTFYDLVTVQFGVLSFHLRCVPTRLQNEPRRSAAEAGGVRNQVKEDANQITANPVGPPARILLGYEPVESDGVGRRQEDLILQVRGDENGGIGQRFPV